MSRPKVAQIGPCWWWVVSLGYPSEKGLTCWSWHGDPGDTRKQLCIHLGSFQGTGAGAGGGFCPGNRGRGRGWVLSREQGQGQGVGSVKGRGTGGGSFSGNRGAGVGSFQETGPGVGSFQGTEAGGGFHPLDDVERLEIARHVTPEVSRARSSLPIAIYVKRQQILVALT